MDQMKPFKELNLLDDFLFSVAAEDMEFCRHMLQVILGKKIISIERRQAQKDIKTLPPLRGIRLDLLIEDSEGTIYNVEVQIRNTYNLPKRSRFYQGLIDMPLLLRGEDDFNNLNNVYLIIISPFDLFGAGKYCYTFENICREDRSIALGDGAVRMFLNTNGTNSSEVSPELIAFLKYVKNSSDQTELPCEDENLRYIRGYIRKLKASKEIGVAYMQSWEKERLLIAKGKIEGKTESILDFLQDLGSVPEELREKILNEKDLSILQTWLKLAAKAVSIEDFCSKI